MATFATEMETACRIARQAGETALRYFRRSVAVECKPDASPVTAADRECERLIASALEDAFPADGLMGEEGSAKESTSGRRWWIDPIDGTRDFVRGSTAWAVMLALEAGHDIAAGVVHFPATNETFFASAGGGAFANGERIRVSGVGSAAEAVLCVNGLNNLGRYAFAPWLLEWMEPFWAVRSMGGCIDAMMLARGQAEVWLDASGKPWDFAAIKVIAEEAGARFFDFAGRRTIHGGNCILAVPGLEDEARRLLSMG